MKPIFLPVRTPVFSAATDTLVGSLPAAANPSILNWYCSHALALTVSGNRLGVRNSGWRANPYLTIAEADAPADPVGTALSLLASGFYVSFCGLYREALPDAGLITGADGSGFSACVSSPDGTLKHKQIGFDAFRAEDVRVLRGLRVQSVPVSFDRRAAREEIRNYLFSADRSEAIRLIKSADPRSHAVLWEQRRVLCGALRRLDPTGAAAASYRARVLCGSGSAAWQAEEEILLQVLCPEHANRAAGGEF